MSDNVIIIGGWAVNTAVLQPLLGADTIYNDINRFMPYLIKDGKLIVNWKEKLKNLIFSGEPKSSVLIGWSTGAIAALAIAPLVNISKLVLLSATPSFCRKGDFRLGIRPIVIQTMINALKKDPNTVLRDFYRECGFDEHDFYCDYYSKEELICGLQFLEQVSLFPVSPQKCPVICLHGTDDRIIPVEAGKYLCEHVNGKWFEVKGPHAFFNKEIQEINKIKDIIFPERNESDVTV